MKITQQTLQTVLKSLLVLVFAFGILLIAPEPSLAQQDCHIGNPECTPIAGALEPAPGLVRISHGRPDGAPYYVGEYIYINMYHATGGYVYVYDWQPYMGNWARLLWRLWLPAGRTRVAVAQVVPPTGPEWLTIYDPYTGAYDRTHFQVVGGYQPPWPWSEEVDGDHDVVLEFKK